MQKATYYISLDLKVKFMFVSFICCTSETLNIYMFFK